MANYRPNNIKNIIKTYNQIFPNSGKSNRKYPKKLIKKSKKLLKKLKFL